MASVATVRPTKLFIGGLSQNTTTKVLRTHFSAYGKVLDCVAMFNQDGRARSFGYVTLDSLSAAESCVAQPQVIDSRVVDVKLAVPEAAAGKKAPSTRARRAVSASSKTALSASAPVFVPLDLEAAFEGLSDTDTDYDEENNDVFEDVKIDVAAHAEKPTEEAADVPLSMEAMAARLAAAGVGAPPGLSLTPITGLPAVRPPPPGFAPPPPPAAPGKSKAGEAMALADDEDASTEAPSSAVVSPAVSQAQLEEDEAEDASEEVPFHLPSLGSSLHASGNCRPCNFFGKGRCGNGTDCEFCHMPHQKRKPTRQEKRERAAAWHERQEAKAEEARATAVAEKAAKTASIEEQQKASLAVVQPIGSLVPTAIPGLMFNFDCYSDDSDDDEDDFSAKAVVAAAVPEEKKTAETFVPEEERVWSRELMLAVQLNLKGASEDETLKLIAVR